MLTTSVIEGTNVVRVTLQGPVGATEGTAAWRVFQQVADQHGQVRMLLDYGGLDLSRWSRPRCGRT